MRSEYTHFQVLGRWDLFKEIYMEPKYDPQKSVFPCCSGTQLGAWLDHIIPNATCRWRSGHFPTEWLILSRDIPPNQGWNWKHIKICRFCCVGENPTKMNSFGFLIYDPNFPPSFRRWVTSLTTKIRKGNTTKSPPLNIPSPKTRNLSYNHWFYTALRSCFRRGNTQTPEGMFNTFLVYMLSPNISLNDPKMKGLPSLHPTKPLKLLHLQEMSFFHNFFQTHLIFRVFSLAVRFKEAFFQGPNLDPTGPPGGQSH